MVNCKIITVVKHVAEYSYHYWERFTFAINEGDKLVLGLQLFRAYANNVINLKEWITYYYNKQVTLNFLMLLYNGSS